MQALVKKDGSVDILRVVQGLPAGLTESAIQALRQWQFKPGTNNSEAIEISVNVEVNFNLRR